MKEVRNGPHKYYKGKYFLIFYDKTDEIPLYIFNNVREILTFKNKEANKYTVNQINQELYRALRSEEHFVTFLTGKVMRVYMISIEEDE